MEEGTASPTAHMQLPHHRPLAFLIPHLQLAPVTGHPNGRAGRTVEKKESQLEIIKFHGAWARTRVGGERNDSWIKTKFVSCTENSCLRVVFRRSLVNFRLFAQSDEEF